MRDRITRKNRLSNAENPCAEQGSGISKNTRPVKKPWLLTSGPWPLLSHFAASCAHFASVVRNGFAAAGGSTSPVSDAFDVTMCP
jgi:hypothetical protein